MNMEVPKALIKLWIDLARNIKTDQVVKERALKMLNLKVGTPEQQIQYMKANHIK